MGLESRDWTGKQEKGIQRAQENSMNLGGVADGYKNQVEQIFSTPAAPAIRNEVKKYLNVADMEGPEQLEELQQLVRALEAYKKNIDMPEDSFEKAALALALVRREKSLQ